MFGKVIGPHLQLLNLLFQTRNRTGNGLYLSAQALNTHLRAMGDVTGFSCAVPGYMKGGCECLPFFIKRLSPLTVQGHLVDRPLQVRTGFRQGLLFTFELALAVRKIGANLFNTLPRLLRCGYPRTPLGHHLRLQTQGFLQRGLPRATGILG